MALALRVALIYIYLLVIVRLSGKRTVAEGTPFDLVVAFVIGDLPGSVIWGDIPVLQGIVAIGSIALLHLLIVLGAYHFPAIDRLVNSIPSVLVRNGKFDPKDMAFQRVSTAEADAFLRESDVFNRAEVALAQLEPSGRLFVKRNPEADYARKRDL